MVAPPTKFDTGSTVLFHKDGGGNVAVTTCMSHFSMFVPTKATVKLDNGKTGHAQGIGIILCQFPNCLIIYPVHDIDNGDINSDVPVASNYESVPYPDTTPIKFIDEPPREWNSQPLAAHFKSRSSPH